MLLCQNTFYNRTISNIILCTTINLYYKIVMKLHMSDLSLFGNILFDFHGFTVRIQLQNSCSSFTSRSVSSFIHVVLWSAGNLSRENTPVSNIVALSGGVQHDLWKNPALEVKIRQFRRRRIDRKPNLAKPKRRDVIICVIGSVNHQATLSS